MTNAIKNKYADKHLYCMFSVLMLDHSLYVHRENVVVCVGCILCSRVKSFTSHPLIMTEAAFKC